MLMALDPGVHTGVAVKSMDRYATCTFLDPDDVWSFIKDNAPSTVAFEVFIRSNRIDANMLHTIEMVGSIRGICYVLGIPAYGQFPQARRSFIPEARTILKADKDATVHEVDALAHLLLLEYRITRHMLDPKTNSGGRR